MKSISFPLIIPGGILLISSPILLIFPIFKEDIKEINYCYAFEKILARNMFKKNNMPNWIKNTSKFAINKFVENSKGDFLRESYRENDPETWPDLHCIIGYYGEHFDPGSTSDAIFQEFKEIWNEN
tara:strand:+ start:905 stop:1282 length:378 start_codon:yes stop_codon:yes gene_type:complete